MITITKWKNVKILEATYLKIVELSGNQSIGKFIDKAVNKYRKHNEEITQLKLKVQELEAQIVTMPNGSNPSETENPTKEEWKQSIQDNPAYEPVNPLSVECYYHAYNPLTKKHFCEEKPIDGYACARRYQRFRAMKRRCVPIGRNNNSKRKLNHRARGSAPNAESTETPIRIRCLRGITVYSNDRRIICEENCKLNHPHEYRACHESIAEGIFKGEAGITSTF